MMSSPRRFIRARRTYGRVAHQDGRQSVVAARQIVTANDEQAISDVIIAATAAKGAPTGFGHTDSIPAAGGTSANAASWLGRNRRPAGAWARYRLRKQRRGSACANQTILNNLLNKGMNCLTLLHAKS